MGALLPVSLSLWLSFFYHCFCFFHLVVLQARTCHISL
jgi:hypothetical protein